MNMTQLMKVSCRQNMRNLRALCNCRSSYYVTFLNSPGLLVQNKTNCLLIDSLFKPITSVHQREKHVKFSQLVISKVQLSNNIDATTILKHAELKFIYSEKATKFLRNLHLFLTGTKGRLFSESGMQFFHCPNLKKKYSKKLS